MNNYDPSTHPVIMQMLNDQAALQAANTIQQVVNMLEITLAAPAEPDRETMEQLQELMDRWMDRDDLQAALVFCLALIRSIGNQVEARFGKEGLDLMMLMYGALGFKPKEEEIPETDRPTGRDVYGTCQSCGSTAAEQHRLDCATLQ